MNEQEYQELMALVDYIDDNQALLETKECTDYLCEISDNWKPYLTV